MDASRQPFNFDKFGQEVRLAYQEYLTVPTIIITAFLVLAITMIYLEKSGISSVDQLREGIKNIALGKASSTQTALSAATGALISITAITFTELLIAVQQAAGAMSPMIIDQFLRRPFNQVAFGYFVGMSIDLKDVASAGSAGIALGVGVFAITGTVLVALDKLTGGTGLAGIAAASTAGNAAAVPVAVAAAYAGYKVVSSTATVQVAASVIVTAILVPLFTAWYSRKVQRRSEGAAQAARAESAQVAR